jgi:hypothetical protein
MGSVVSSDNEGPPEAASVHDKCGRCPHERRRHIGGGCILCPEGEDRHAFVLAEPDAAQKAAMDELIHLRQEMEETEPEAPECRYPGGCPLESGLCPADKGCAFAIQLIGGAMMPRPEAPERRLPFTLMYALASGERREVTLSGDVAVRVAEDGALIITHESLVRALTEIRPVEDR